MGIEDVEPAHQQDRQACGIDPMANPDPQAVAAEGVMRAGWGQAKGCAQPVRRNGGLCGHRRLPCSPPKLTLRLSPVGKAAKRHSAGTKRGYAARRKNMPVSAERRN